MLHITHAVLYFYVHCPYDIQTINTVVGLLHCMFSNLRCEANVQCSQVLQKVFIELMQALCFFCSLILSHYGTKI